MTLGLEVRIFDSSLASVNSCNDLHLSSGHCVRHWAKSFSCIISFDPFHISRSTIPISVSDVKVETQEG